MQVMVDGRNRGVPDWSCHRAQIMGLFIAVAVTPSIDLVHKSYIIAIKLIRANAHDWT